ncbi:MAG: toll/interleukin-1 receptor domain-containing protein [Methylococcales bacterium]|nr:toll/interleukin-1 receptor domain-containing protein [Methylococcales bacterium]
MPTWNTDAQFAKNINHGYLYSNGRISDFLSPQSYDQFIIVASKGMGKTLLLRHKRKVLENEKKGLILIPKNSTADYVTLPSSPPKDLINSFHDEVFWEDIWKISVSISALLNFPHEVSDDEIGSITGELKRVHLPVPLTEEITKAFSGEFKLERTPSSVLNILLQSGKASIEKTRASGVHVIWDIYNRYITSGCFIFIDSFDQALNKLFSDNLEIWCAAQTGLMKAAWEVSRHNRHAKIFTTIRQEAYSSFSDGERANLRGNVLLIEYTSEDLEAIFTNAVKHYESVQSIEEFVGFEKMYNGYLRTHEKIFDYIHRHTIGVPRWLITIGSEISNSRKERGIISDTKKKKSHQKLIADIVNRVSAEDLAYVYLKGEMRLFFKGGVPEKFVDNLLSKINSSVLSFSSIDRISKKFVSEHVWEGTKHPFCLLYNLGLLGLVASTASTVRKKQVFKKPYEFDWNFERILPIDPNAYYFLHPSLHHLIQKKNYRFNFNKVKIGDGLTWGKMEEKRIQSEILKIFISYSHSDWERIEKIVDAMEEYLNVKAVLHDIWLDKWKMRGGRWFQDQMMAGINESDFLVFMVSKNSVESSAVAVEWKSKFSDKISNGEDTVFPFMIDDSPYNDIPLYLQNIFSYRYDNNKDIVIKLVDDIMFWKSEQCS